MYIVDKYRSNLASTAFPAQTQFQKLMEITGHERNLVTYFLPKLQTKYIIEDFLEGGRIMFHSNLLIKLTHDKVCNGLALIV